jgi:hypothetical protein
MSICPSGRTRSGRSSRRCGNYYISVPGRAGELSRRRREAAVGKSSGPKEEKDLT